MLDVVTAILEKITTAIIAVLMVLGIVGDEPQPTILEEKPIITILDDFEEKIGGSLEESPISEEETKIPPVENPPEVSLVAPPETQEEEEIVLSQELIDPIVLNTIVRDSVVNILCLSKQGGLLAPITGSGIIIDERGVILTNAHVAQYVLLKDLLTPNYIECVIRIGSPSQPRYRVELLTISSSWVEENAQNLVSQKTSSTGEDDYALLYITARTDPNASLPDSFPALTPFPIIDDIQKGDPVIVASYPAGFLGGISITRGLWLTSSISTIKRLFTFSLQDFGPLDLVSVGGVIGAQEGSSGGAVVSFKDARLLGVIVTRTEGDTTGERSLNALTLLHINKGMLEERGEDLQAFLVGSLQEKVDSFAEGEGKRLTEILTDALLK